MSMVPSTGLVGHAAFDAIVVAQFPEVAEELDSDDRTLLHVEVAAVARATCRAIENSDRETEARHFAILEGILGRAASDVENAIYVSYLENVFLGETRAAYIEARRRLPPRLARGLLALEEHWAHLAGGKDT